MTNRSTADLAETCAECGRDHSPDMSCAYPFGERSAMTWVAEFDRIYPDQRPDTDTMLGWFANAIETGVMLGERAAARPADGEGLRAYAEAALTDFIAEHGSDFDGREWPGMAALRSVLDARPISQDLYDAAVEVLRLGNQPGLNDDEWEAAMAAMEAALAAPNDLPKLFREYRDWGIAIGRARLDPERLARAMSRLTEVGPPAHLSGEQAEDHWRSYLTEATELAAEYAALAANPSPVVVNGLSFDPDAWKPE